MIKNELMTSDKGYHRTPILKLAGIIALIIFYHIIIALNIFYRTGVIIARHYYARARAYKKNKGRIFCIGFSRTGTRSLHRYLQNLRYRSIHWPGEYLNRIKDYVDNPKRVVEILGPLFDQYDCFSDAPFPGLYKELDERFPNSKFILTYRDQEKWWQSICRLWKLQDIRKRELNSFEYIQYRLYEPREKKNYSIKDKDVLINKFNKHFNEVTGYFKDRKSDLLILKLEDSSLNVKVSNFLNKRVLDHYPLIKDMSFSDRSNRLKRLMKRYFRAVEQEGFLQVTKYTFKWMLR